MARRAGVEGCDAVVEAHASLAGDSGSRGGVRAVAGVVADARTRFFAHGVLARRGSADSGAARGAQGAAGVLPVDDVGDVFPVVAAAGDGAGDGMEASGAAGDSLRPGGGDRAVGSDGDRTDEAGALRDAGVSGARISDGGRAGAVHTAGAG